MNRLARLVTLVLVGAWLAPLAPTHAEAGPVGPVERVTTQLLTVMREAEKLGFEGRYQALEPVLRESFRFPLMAQMATGRHWRELSEAQALLAEYRALNEALEAMPVHATIASRFADPGVNGLYAALLRDLEAKTGVAVRSDFLAGAATEIGDNITRIIPPNRLRWDPFPVPSAATDLPKPG
jgi:hypothetical protein